MKNIRVQDWQNSELIDPLTGRLGKKMSGVVFVPGTVRLSRDEGHLQWRGLGRPKLFQENAFDEFLELAVGKPKDILRYARNWGTLHINRDTRMQMLDGYQLDPIDEWHYYSTRAGALVSLASALRSAQVGSYDQWAQLGIGPWMSEKQKKEVFARVRKFSRYSHNLPAHNLPDPRRANPYELGIAIQDELNAWIKVANIGVTVRFAGSEVPNPWQMRVEWNAQLFSALSLQLVYAVSAAKLSYHCHSCGKLYSRTRRPVPGREDYCPSCGRKSAVRDANRRLRAKRSRVLKLAKRGVVPEVIAQRMRTTSLTVRRWIEKEAH